MNTETDQQEAARQAGSRYGTMAADLSLVHITTAATDEEMQEHIADLARNIREQAAQRIREDLGEDLAAVWKGCCPQGRSGPSGGLWRAREGLTHRLTTEDRSSLGDKPAIASSQPIGGYKHGFLETPSPALNHRTRR
jgi:hypothetical protein